MNRQTVIVTVRRCCQRFLNGFFEAWEDLSTDGMSNETGAGSYPNAHSIVWMSLHQPIPCLVAPQQSQTPFGLILDITQQREAKKVLLKKESNWSEKREKTDRTYDLIESSFKE